MFHSYLNKKQIQIKKGYWKCIFHIICLDLLKRHIPTFVDHEKVLRNRIVFNIGYIRRLYVDALSLTKRMEL